MTSCLNIRFWKPFFFLPYTEFANNNNRHCVLFRRKRGKEREKELLLSTCFHNPIKERSEEGGTKGKIRPSPFLSPFPQFSRQTIEEEKDSPNNKETHVITNCIETPCVRRIRSPLQRIRNPTCLLMFPHFIFHKGRKEGEKPCGCGERRREGVLQRQRGPSGLEINLSSVSSQAAAEGRHNKPKPKSRLGEKRGSMCRRRLS